MSYRDETTALAEQNKALERELSEKNREIVALRSSASDPRTPAQSLPIIARRARSLRLAGILALVALVLFATAVVASMTGLVRPPWDVLFALAGMSATLSSLAAFAMLVTGSYVIVPPGLALVTSTGRGHQVTMPGHARMVFPFVAATSWVDVAPRTVRTLIELRLRDDARVTIELVARAQPRGTTESVLRLFAQFNSATNDDRDELVRSRLDSAGRSILSRATTRDLDSERSELEDRLRSDLSSPLDDVGLEIVEVRFTVR